MSIPRKITKEQIIDAMRECGNNRAMSARVLGVDPKTIQDRILRDPELRAAYGGDPIEAEPVTIQQDGVPESIVKAVERNERDARQIVNKVFEDIGISSDTIERFNSTSQLDKDPVAAMEFMLQFAQQSQVVDMAVLTDMVSRYQKKEEESAEYPEEAQGWARLSLKAFEMKQKAAKSMIDGVQNMISIYSRNNKGDDDGGGGNLKPKKVQPAM